MIRAPSRAHAAGKITAEGTTNCEIAKALLATQRETMQRAGVVRPPDIYFLEGADRPPL